MARSDGAQTVVIGVKRTRKGERFQRSQKKECVSVHQRKGPCGGKRNGQDAGGDRSNNPAKTRKKKHLCGPK